MIDFTKSNQEEQKEETVDFFDSEWYSKNWWWIATSVITFCLFIGISIATTFSYTYDTDTPVGTDAPSVLDNRIREVKDAVQERENVDHYWPLTGTEVSDADAGEHRKILFHAPIATTPTVAASHGELRTKDVSSKAELHWTDEDENELQITSGGALNIVSADLVGTLANNTYFTAVDAAGTGTVDLIKANASDAAVVPDGSETATSGAPTADADISNKKYVDDQITANVGAQNYTPTSYTGGESVTYPNGLIFKGGVVASIPGLGSSTVTFGTAFPNALLTAAVSQTISNASEPMIITARSTTAITIKNATGGAGAALWQAWGY